MNRKLSETLSFLRKNRKDVVLTIAIAIVLNILILGIFFFLPKPNDSIYPSKKNFLFESNNPQFKVGFGNKQSSKQYIRFESKASSKNPFEESNQTFIQEIKERFPLKKKGFEMSLIGVKINDDENTLSQTVQNLGKQLESNDIYTDTEVREDGSKPTVVNRDIYPGVDIEYQILEGYGLKEDIVIKDIEEYTSSCGISQECKIPLNEFVFDLVLDEGVELKSSKTLHSKGEEPTYYFTNQNGSYLAHFLPTFAVDDTGTKTNSVDMKVEKVSERNYKVHVVLDPSWLFSPQRKFPVRIDPSVVHDTELEFDLGTLDRVKIEEGPNLKLSDSYTSGGYISEVIELEALSTIEKIQYVSSGESTGNGEIPYSTTGLIIEHNLNEEIANTGECGPDCNINLRNLSEGEEFTIEHRRWGTAALLCDGIDDYGYIQNSELFNSLDSFSFEMWFKPTQQMNENQTIAGSERFGFGTYEGEFGFWVNGSENMVKTEIPEIGKWSYWVGTYNGSNIALFKNGVQVGDIEYSEELLPTNTQFRVCSGTQDGSNYTYTKGVIDTVRIYDRALLEGEIISNYNMSDINLSYRTSIDGQNWSDWSHTEEDLELELKFPQITVEETEEGSVESSSFVQEIEPIDLSNIDNLSFEFLTNNFDQGVKLNYGPTLYSINQKDENTLGLWHEIKESLLVEEMTEQVLFDEDGNWSMDILLQTEEEILDGDILGFGESNTLTLSLSDRSINVDIKGSKSELISKLGSNKEYLITLTSDEVGIKVYVNGIYIKDISQGESEIGENILVVDPSIVNIKTLHISDIARTERDVRQLYEYIIGQRSYTFNVSFKANLSTVNTVDNLDDTTFVIDERTYGAEESIENLNIGDRIVISEEEYRAQGVVESLDTQTGEVTVKQWEEGSTVPTEGFSENCKVYRWQKEYITLKDVLPEDREGISYFSLDTPQGEDSYTYFKNFKVIEYTDFSLFESIEDIQYIQYKVVLSRKDLDISPFLREVEIIHSVPGPTMDQVMRHGKWFNSSGEEQSFWWVGEN
jgi:hypothetical protein